jgi:GDP-L-fucose synthase
MPEQSRLSKSTGIFVAGHGGLVGSAVVRRLQVMRCNNILVRTHAELDLTQADAVDSFFQHNRPEFVFLCAAKVGGILANASNPVEFLRDNLLIQAHIMQSAWKYGVKKLLCLGSSCIYPRSAPQPIKEEYLLSGPLEATNEAYAIAKIAGLKLASAYYKQYGVRTLCVMPTNLYGPEDNFDMDSSHVVPALIRRFHEANEKNLPVVTLWGTGTPRREFLHVDDLAQALCFLMENYDSPELLNIGWGKDLTISELAQLVAKIVGFKGEIRFDPSRPDGTPRRLLDISRISSLGWKPTIRLKEGLALTYEWYKTHALGQRVLTVA